MPKMLKVKKIARNVFQFIRAAWYWLVFVLVWPLIWNYERHRAKNRTAHSESHWAAWLLASKGMLIKTKGKVFWE